MLERVNGYEVERVPLDEHLFVYEVRDKDRLLDDAARDARINPYGGVLWDSSARAARALMGDERVRARPNAGVVDVACGLGAIALFAARAGRRAIALDKDATARALCEAAASALDLKVLVDEVDLLDAPPAYDDCIWVLADVLYEPALARASARFCAALVERGARCVVVDPGRAARTAFLELAREARFVDVDGAPGLQWSFLGWG